MNQIAPRVRQRRRELALTQDMLCARVAHATYDQWVPSRKDVRRIETGTRIVSDIEILYLAKSLGCFPCWILTGDGAVS